MRFLGVGLTNSLCRLFLKRRGFALHFTAMTIDLFMCMCAKLGPKRFLMWRTRSNFANPKGSKCKILPKPSNLPKRIETSLYKNGMNTLLDTPKKVDYSAPNIVIEMASGIVLSFPANDNPRLAKGSSAQLRNVEVSPLGLHWPDLDEDLSFEGLLRGDFGQHQY